MGRPIQTSSVVIGDILILDGDRAITGQDGTVYSSAAEADADGRFPGRLAARIFAADGSVDHVFVASNQVVARRRGGWNDDAVAGVAGVVSEFFVFYR